MTETASGGEELLVKIRADISEIGPLLEKVTEFLGARQISDDIRRRVMLSIEEITVNAIEHGGQPQRSIEIAVRLAASRILAAVSYHGAEFDPTTPRANPKSPEKILAGELGGHGLFLTQQVSDRVEYARVTGVNQVKLEFVV